MRKTLIAAALLSTTGGLSAAEIIDAIHKDLKIMTGMLQTALSSDDDRNMRAHISSQYLVGQGIVLRIRPGGGWGEMHSDRYFSFDRDDFDFQIDRFVDGVLEDVDSAIDYDMAIAVGIPEAPEPGDLHDLEILQLMEHNEGVSLHSSSEVVKAIREQRNAQRKQRRDFERAAQDYQRQMDTLKEEMNAGGDEGKIQRQMEDVRKVFETERLSYQRSRDASREKLKQQAQIRERKRQEDINKLTNNTVEAICTYGSPLRKIGDARYVTLVFENVVRDKPGREDLYYVFERKKLENCMAGKTSAEKVLAGSTSYSF
jgi:hypothetical protein